MSLLSIYEKKAEKIGVEIKAPSRDKNAKFDAFKDGVFQNSFGGKGYKDFESYKKEDGIAVANKRRSLYKKRHDDTRKIKFRDGKLTASYLSDKILW